MMDHEVGAAEETLCPRCGADATWVYADGEATRVEVRCRDCGLVSMSRSEFDIAEADISVPGEDEA